MGLNNKQKAVLHVARAKLALDEDTYRDALEAHGGARSSSDLSYGGFLRVMRHFEICGFARRRTTDDGRRTAGRPGMATAAQIRKIYAIWWALGTSYYEPGKELKALRGFLKKRFRVDHENFLKFGQAHAVIEAIKAITARGQRTDDRGQINRF